MSWLISILDAINRLHVFSTEDLANFCKVPGTKYFCGPCGLTANIPLCCCGSHGHLQMSNHGSTPTWLFMDAEIWIYVSSKCHKILFFKICKHLEMLKPFIVYRPYRNGPRQIPKPFLALLHCCCLLKHDLLSGNLFSILGREQPFGLNPRNREFRRASLRSPNSHVGPFLFSWEPCFHCMFIMLTFKWVCTFLADATW